VAQPGRYTIFRTDSGVDFLAALAQNAAIFANLALPGGIGIAPFWVQSLEIISVENLAWELWFFNRTTTAVPADPDDDGFRGRWSFQAADGVRIGGAGTYHYAIDGLAIPVECSDYRLHPGSYAELHMALVNRSAAGKSADGAGAIMIQLALGGGLGGI